MFKIHLLKKDELRNLTRLFLKPHLLMIRFSLHNPETAVDLLQQDKPHELMGKGHAAEADFFICPI